MTITWASLSPETWRELHRDLVQYREKARVLNRAELAKIIGSSKRAERIKRWISQNGDKLPELPKTVVKKGERLPRICFVGDTHVEPGQDLRRFRWLGQLCRDLLDGPDDEIIWFGDHFNMDALYYRQSEVAKEGKRFNLEKKWGNMARQIFDTETYGLALRKTVLEGNHCARVKDFTSRHPFFKDAVDPWDEFDEAGWNVVPFDGGHGFYETHGWRCQHFVPGRNGKATSSATGNSRAVLDRVLKYQESVAFGHTHEYDLWHHASRNGRRVRAINVGCFFEHSEDYAGKDSNGRWWRGVLVLTNVQEGDGDLHEFRLETLQRRYA